MHPRPAQAMIDSLLACANFRRKNKATLDLTDARPLGVFIPVDDH